MMSMGGSKHHLLDCSLPSLMICQWEVSVWFETELIIIPINWLISCEWIVLNFFNGRMDRLSTTTSEYQYLSSYSSLLSSLSLSSIFLNWLTKQLINHHLSLIVIHFRSFFFSLLQTSVNLNLKLYEYHSDQY